MGRTEPIGWSDLSEEVQEVAIRTLIKKRGASRDEACEAVDSAAAKLIARQVIPRNVQALLISSADNVLLTERYRQARYRQVDRVSDTGAEDQISGQGTPWEPSVPDLQTQIIDGEARMELIQELRLALSQLSDSDRQALAAFYGEGRPAAEIDRAEGRPIGKARSKLHRARKRLRIAFEARRQAAGHSK